MLNQLSSERPVQSEAAEPDADAEVAVSARARLMKSYKDSLKKRYEQEQTRKQTIF